MFEIKYAKSVTYDLKGLNAGQRNMKLVNLERAILDICVKDAQHENVVITSKGKPVAIIVGVEGMDEEQLELGVSDKFWNLITERRNQDAISRAELELDIKG